MNLLEINAIVSKTTWILFLPATLIEVYTPYVRLCVPGRCGGSQITVIECSVVATTLRFRGGDGGTTLF